MTDNLDEPRLCKMSRREKMKHLQSVSFASELQTNPMSEANLVKTFFSQVCAVHARLAPKAFPGVLCGFIFIQERTRDVEPRWTSDSLPTLADHHSRRGNRLVSFCLKRIPKSAWWRCVRLMMNSLTMPHSSTHSSDFVNSSSSAATSSALDQTSMARREGCFFVAVDVPHWSAFLQPRGEVCQRLSRSLANAVDHRNKENVLDGKCGDGCHATT